MRSTRRKNSNTRSIYVGKLSAVKERIFTNQIIFLIRFVYVLYMRIFNTFNELRHNNNWIHRVEINSKAIINWRIWIRTAAEFGLLKIGHNNISA